MKKLFMLALITSAFTFSTTAAHARPHMNHSPSPTIATADPNDPTSDPSDPGSGMVEPTPMGGGWFWGW